MERLRIYLTTLFTVAPSFATTFFEVSGVSRFGSGFMALALTSSNLAYMASFLVGSLLERNRLFRAWFLASVVITTVSGLYPLIFPAGELEFLTVLALTAFFGTISSLSLTYYVVDSSPQEDLIPSLRKLNLTVDLVSSLSSLTAYYLSRDFFIVILSSLLSALAGASMTADLISERSVGIFEKAVVNISRAFMYVTVEPPLVASEKLSELVPRSATTLLTSRFMFNTSGALFFSTLPPLFVNRLGNEMTVLAIGLNSLITSIGYAIPASSKLRGTASLWFRSVMMASALALINSDPLLAVIPFGAMGIGFSQFDTVSSSLASQRMSRVNRFFLTAAAGSVTGSMMGAFLIRSPYETVPVSVGLLVVSSLLFLRA